MTTPDGYTLPAVVTLPFDLDPNKKYPVLINIYGGPNAGTVSDGWKGIGNEWYAQEGLIQISIDHRAAGHHGKEGVALMHRVLGKWEMNDYIEWVKWLRTKPYVDAKRVGITGSSYGGYVTAMAPHVWVGVLHVRYRPFVTEGLEAVRHTLHRALHGYAGRKSGWIQKRFGHDICRQIQGWPSHCPWDAGWIGLGLYVLLAEGASPNALNDLGFILLAFAIFNTYTLLWSTRVTAAVFLVFLTLEITEIVLSIGFLSSTGGVANDVVKIGGYIGILTAAVAWYTSAAGVVNGMAGRPVLEVGAPLWKDKPVPALGPEMQVPGARERVS